MIIPALVCGLVAALGAVSVSADEFPLTFHAIPAKDVVAFPGGYGMMGQIRLAKPAKLKKSPKAISLRPLYGECREGSAGAGYVFRLDESKGDGKGYDELLLDINQNGDLTDDAPARLVTLPKDRKAPSRPAREKLFGPIEVPPGTLIAGGRPAFFAQAYVNDIRSVVGSGQNAESIYAGYVRLKAGWYVDTTVELKGLTQKVGLFDANGNLRLGDVPKPQTYRSGDEENWYFRDGDAFLVDVDHSGAFERDQFETESCSCGPLLYFGTVPYKVALTADRKSLQVEPWTDALAEVTLQPHGDQVSRVGLAWERPDKQWSLIRAGVADGKLKVPPGNYRLMECELLGKAAPRDQVKVMASQSVQRKPVSFTCDKPNTLRCGAPLEIKASAEKRRPESWETGRGGLQDPPLASDSEFVLSINAKIRGADGEVYAEFAKGEKLANEPPLPSFTVLTADGKKVGDGKLEFG